MFVFIWLALSLSLYIYIDLPSPISQLSVSKKFYIFVMVILTTIKLREIEQILIKSSSFISFVSRSQIKQIHRTELNSFLFIPIYFFCLILFFLVHPMIFIQHNQWCAFLFSIQRNSTMINTTIDATNMFFSRQCSIMQINTFDQICFCCNSSLWSILYYVQMFPYWYFLFVSFGLVNWFNVFFSFFSSLCAYLSMKLERLMKDKFNIFEFLT